MAIQSQPTLSNETRIQCAIPLMCDKRCLFMDFLYVIFDCLVSLSILKSAIQIKSIIIIINSW